MVILVLTKMTMMLFSVGKTSLIRQFVYNVFHDYYNPTLRVDYLTKSVYVDDQAMTLQVWGQICKISYDLS